MSNQVEGQSVSPNDAKPVVMCRFSKLEVGDLFKLEDRYHIQIKAAYQPERSWVKYPYHSAEHRCVVIMNADPDMLVARYNGT